MDWESLNQGIRELGSALAERAKEKRDQENTIRLLLLKAKLEQSAKEEAFRSQIGMYREMFPDMFGGGGQSPSVSAPTGTESIVPVSGDRSQYRMMPKFNLSGEGMSMSLSPEMTPEAQLRQKVTETRMLTKEKGLPIETGGKLAMVKQAKQDIQEVRDMLFPGGNAESFKRGLAFASNLPGSRAPLIGAVIPQALPYMPFWANASKKGQMIYSRLQNAVAAKLRVETGAQANPSEVENILARFGVTSASSPQAAWDAIKRLENFMDETISITDPTGAFTSPTIESNKNLESLKSKYGLE